MCKYVLLACAALACVPASADPGYYVVTAYDNKDEKALDFRYWSVQNPGRAATIWPEIGFSYGFSSRWTSELYLSFIGQGAGDLAPSSWNWENAYLLTQGQYPIDVALHSKLSRAHDSEDGYTLELGPALQTDVGRLQLNGNVFLEHNYRSEYTNTTQMKYQWQGKYRWKETFQPGWQGFGELGDWNTWAPRGQQSHRLGPAVFGSIATGAHSSLRYQAAYLFGKVNGKSAEMLTMRVQWVF